MMLKSKNGFDEMQKARRDRIGNQMLLILCYALMVDSGLYGFGVRWIAYPANVMAILMVCMSIYLVRLIMLGAYLPPGRQNGKSVATMLILKIVTISLTLAALNYFMPYLRPSAPPPEDNSASILMIVSAVGLTGALIAAISKRVRNKTENDD